MLKNIKDSLEISYKQGLESDDIIYIKGQIKDWEEMLSNIRHEQELKDNALKLYEEELNKNSKAIKRIEEGIYSDYGEACKKDSQDLLEILKGEK